MRGSTLVTLGTLLGTLSLAGAAAAQDAASAAGPTFTPLGAAPTTDAERAVTFTPGRQTTSSAATGATGATGATTATTGSAAGATAPLPPATPVREYSAPTPTATGGGPTGAGVTFTAANIPPNTPYQMDPCIAAIPIPVTGNVGPDGAWHPATLPPVVVGGGPGARCTSTPTPAPTANTAVASPAAESAPAPAQTTSTPAAGNRARLDIPEDPWATRTGNSPSAAAAPDGYRPPALPDADADEANPYAAPAPAGANSAAIPTPVPPFPNAPGADQGEPNPYRGPATPPANNPPNATGGGPAARDFPIE